MSANYAAGSKAGRGRGQNDAVTLQQIVSLNSGPPLPSTGLVGNCPVPQRSNQDSLLLLEEEGITANTSRSNVLEPPRGKKRRNGDTELSPKKKKPKGGYAEPERYAHLVNGLSDIIAPELDGARIAPFPPKYVMLTASHHTKCYFVVSSQFKCCRGYR